MIVQALGKLAKFGAIYDAKNNEFTGINIFKEKIDDQYIEVEENPNTTYKFSFASRESDKMDAFDIQGELKLRIWCGLIEVNGSASYIKNNRNNSRSIQCSYILKSTTKKESFNWRLEKLKNHFDFSGVEDMGTHMVIGIQYGGNGVVTLTHTSNECKSVDEIKGNLAGKFKYFPQVNGDISGAGRNQRNETITDDQLDIKVEADVRIDAGDNITNVEGARKFMENLGERLTRYNNGKGVQVSFELIPLKNVLEFFKIQISRQIIYESLQNNVILKISQKLTEIEEIKEELNERIFELEYYQKYFTRADQTWWREKKDRYESEVAGLHIEIVNILKKFQDQNQVAQESLSHESNNIAKLKQDLCDFIQNSSKYVVKTVFVKAASNANIEYVIQEGQLARLKLDKRKLYICLFSNNYYYNNYNLLRQFLNEGENDLNNPELVYLIIDADILADVIKRELQLDELPHHPLYIFENGEYKIDPKTKPTSNSHIVAVGIDLGTTNSCVAVYTNNGVEVLANQWGSKVTPSCVLLEGETPTVGQDAKTVKFGHYNSRVYDTKRMLGKSFSDPVLQDDIKNWPFTVLNDGHDRPVISVPNFQSRKQQLYPENISAFVLQKMKQIVEQMYLGNGEKIGFAVITVPAYFNDAQRNATKKAAELAGLKVLRLLNEPSAAGLGFCYQRQIFNSKKVLVYDLGGGTFDVSIMKVVNGQIDILSVAGDTHLGGNDFDERLTKYCIQKFKKNNGEDITNNENALKRLNNMCVFAKEHLTTSLRYELEIDNLQNGTDFELTLTRTDLEHSCQDLFDVTIKIVDNALKDAKLSPANIDEVLLVGGSSRIPRIQKMLKIKFGENKINKTINADEAVAYGAAIQAAIITGEIEKQCFFINNCVISFD